MKLPKLSSIAWFDYFGGTDIGASRLVKKTGKGMPGETPCLSPCATGASQHQFSKLFSIEPFGISSLLFSSVEG